MKIIFRCEECGKEYSKVTQASECEEGHKVMSLEGNCGEDGVIPNTIDVTFNGMIGCVIVRYRREM